MALEMACSLLPRSAYAVMITRRPKAFAANSVLTQARYVDFVSSIRYVTSAATTLSKAA